MLPRKGKLSITITITIVLIFSLLTFPSETLVLPSDAKALLAFKQKADPHNTLSFNTSLSHCKWPGVQCVGSRVSRLTIEDHTLAGIFPPDSLTRLDQLRALSLRNSSLHGSLPNLSGLLNLKALFLQHNRFSGHFPPSIFSLHRIRTLDLSYNYFTGELPTWLIRLNRLYYLRVEFNSFVGSIPPLNQSTLLVFNVSNNNLSGPVPVTPILSLFDSSCYSQNPRLCGEIVRRECDSKKPFFRPTTHSPAPDLQPTAALTAEELSGVELTHLSANKHRRMAVVLGFTLGVFFLIFSVLCLAMAVKKQRREKGVEGTMASDLSATAGAAAVMRLEEEKEEKVKSAQMKVGKSGSLVFCAGEAQLYSLDLLMRASAEMLGRGMIGTTYKAVLDNRLIVCVKRLDSSKIAGAGKMMFERHMESVGALRHPNLVPLRAYFQAQEERLLVYDYQPNGSLFSLIHGSKSARSKPLHWTSCLKIAEDVAQGLSYIHQAWRLVHGNLKSSNVLLGSDFEACVTDYCLSALAEPAPPSSDNDLNSYAYKAPEIRKSDCQATPKSDVYAFGVLLLELLTSKLPSEHPYLTPTDIVRWVKSTRDVDDGGGDENRLAMLLEVAIACSMASSEHRPNMWQVLKMLQEIKEAVLMEEDDVDPCEGMG